MKILLAVDDSPHADAAARAVLMQFRPADCEICVWHAVEWLREMPQSLRFGQGPTYAADIQAHRNQSFANADALVNRIAGELQAAGFRTTTATPDVEPRQGIVDTATSWHADLIVMGSHGRRGLERLILGSVAEAVVRQAPCSVQIVRLPRN